MGLKEELNFIAGKFLDYVIPKDKKYLSKYYTTEIERQFLLYYLVFRSRKRYLEHTGIHVRKRWLEVLESRLLRIEDIHRKARFDFDLEKVAQIESGKFKIAKI
jgi:hypothetical protein